MGGKGGAKQEVIRYYMAQHFGICMGADAITRILVKEKVAWEGDETAQTAFVIDKDQLFGGRLKEGGVEAVVYWLPGASDQVLPDHLAQRLGKSTGAEVPGYRGVATAFFVGAKGTGFPNFAGGTEPKYGTYWSANNPYLPPVWITVRRAPVGLNPDYALIPRESFEGSVSLGTFDITATFPEIPSSDPDYPDPGDLYPASYVIGPLGQNAAIKVSAEGVVVDDQFVFNGDDYPTGALEVGETVYVLPAGETLTVQVRNLFPEHCGALGEFEAWTLPSNALDANPAHMIYESLTNTDWGMGSPPAAIDFDNFEEVAVTLYNELFGLSMIWTRQSSIQDFIQQILDHINAVLFVDPGTGLLTLKLIRDDYDPDELDELTPDNAELSSFARKLFGEITNEIIVSWTNPETEQEETTPPAQDLASIATQGLISDGRNYFGVRYAALAMRLAWRELASAGQPLATFEAEVDRTQYLLRPASVIKVTWPEYGLDGVVARVTSIDYGRPGDMTIKLSLIEDVFGLDFGAYEEAPPTGWVDPSESPEALTIERIFTMPLFFAANSSVAPFVQTPEYPEVVAGILGTTDQTDAYGHQLWDEVTLPNGDLAWQELSSLNIIGHAELVDALVAEVTSTGVTFDTLIGDTSPTLGGFVIIGDDGEEGNEIAMIDAVGSDYDLVRGVLDTVPRAWPAGTPVWFIDAETVLEYPNVLSAGETLDVKLLTQTSQGVLPLASAALVTHELTERPWLPNRPANVEIDGVMFNTSATPVDMIGESDVPCTWANRNRLTEDSQVLAWDDATVTPETGQTTRIDVLTADLGTVLDTHDALSGTSFSVPVASFGSEAVGALQFWSERTDADGTFTSLQGHVIWVQVAPSLITEGGELLAMESGEALVEE